jgi:hypothetical protein
MGRGVGSRGSGNEGSNKERDIRKKFVEDDLIEAVLLLPENLFYNTTAPGIVMIFNRKKRTKGQILLINASKLFSKGRPKNYLEDQHVEQIADVYEKWTAAEGISAIITTEEAAKNDFNLSPSRYVATDGKEPVLPLDEAVVLLAEAEEERAEMGRILDSLLTQIGFWQSISDSAIAVETELGQLPAHWKVCRLQTLLCEPIKNGVFAKRDRFGSGTPFLNVADIYKSTIVDVAKLERVKCSNGELDVFRLQIGDLVFVRSSLKREGIGQCCLIDHLPETTTYDCHLMRVRLDTEQADPLFLTYYATSPLGKSILVSLSKTTTMTTLNQDGLACFPVPLPPIREQRAIPVCSVRMGETGVVIGSVWGWLGLNE